MSASEKNLRFLVDMLPPRSTWSVAGVGRHQLPLAYKAIEWGGHVRVGLEDNIYKSKGMLAKGSYELVELVVERAERAGRTPATPGEAASALSIV